MRKALAAQVAVCLGLAVWVQLGAVPVVAVHSRVFSALTTVVSLVVLMTAVGMARRVHFRGRSLTLAGMVFPCVLGLGAVGFAYGPMPRFDLAARLFAVATGVGYLTAVALAWRASAPAAPCVITPLDAVLPRPAARWKPAAIVSLCFFSLAAAVIFPSVIVPLGPTTLSERLGNEVLLRGRAGVVITSGLAIALGVTVAAGGALLRRDRPRQRSLARVAVLLCWAGALSLVRYWLDHSR